MDRDFKVRKALFGPLARQALWGTALAPILQVPADLFRKLVTKIDREKEKNKAERGGNAGLMFSCRSNFVSAGRNSPMPIQLRGCLHRAKGELHCDGNKLT